MILAARQPLLDEVEEEHPETENTQNHFQKLFPPGKPLVTICPQDGKYSGPLAIICPELPQIPLSPNYGPLVVQALKPQKQEKPEVLPVCSQAESLSKLPQIKPWIATAVRTIFEVFSGRRSEQAVTNWFTSELRKPFLALVRTERHHPLPTPIQVRRICCRKAGEGEHGFNGIEVAVSVNDGSRVRAVAMRIKPWGKTWRICALEIG
ncbi:Rv3235 family protein [Varibaculum vaginae]|uniref:Rv3235 family protein n=1 Tax=Varibaculum vaginae TaxID=2364797 RepID=UPI000F08BEDD|nr:Rv3235 family protein [Varibaculum vaginae]